MTQAAPTRYLTPPQFAAKLRCKPDTVRAMVKAGLIRALPVGVGKKRPRLRIPVSELKRLEESYEPVVNEKPKRRRTRKSVEPGFIQYY